MIPSSSNYLVNTFSNNAKLTPKGFKFQDKPKNECQCNYTINTGASMYHMQYRTLHDEQSVFMSLPENCLIGGDDAAAGAKKQHMTP